MGTRGFEHSDGDIEDYVLVHQDMGFHYLVVIARPFAPHKKREDKGNSFPLELLSSVGQ